MDHNFTIRRLMLEDYDHGFLQLLSQLTDTGLIDKDMFEKQFDKIGNNPDYIIKVIIDLNAKKIIGAGTIMIEHKFIHQCSSVGHIEDIVIHENYRGRHLGKMLIDELIRSSKEKGCYKTILCCKKELVCFYEKCGMNCKELEMVQYHK